jgi:hypothetical protein
MFSYNLAEFLPVSCAFVPKKPFSGFGGDLAPQAGLGGRYKEK